MGEVIRAMLFLAAFVITGSVATAGDQSANTKGFRVINVTTDSASGWLPSEALDEEAQTTLKAYFRLFDIGNDRAAWDLTTVGFKGVTPFPEFRLANQHSRRELGRLRQLDVLRVTWTKDPANAPAPGIYVAIDIAGQFSKSKRHCGYVVLFKTKESDPFRLARIESNFMTDKTARKIAAGKSPAEVALMWSKLSANCPNYVGPENSAL